MEIRLSDGHHFDSNDADKWDSEHTEELLYRTDKGTFVLNGLDGDYTILDEQSAVDWFARNAILDELPDDMEEKVKKAYDKLAI